MQRSSIHDNAICTAQWQTLIYIYVHGKPLCCDVPPRIAKDPTAAQLWLWIMKSCKDPHGVQNRLYNASHIKTGVAAPAAHTHTDEVPFIAGVIPLTRKNHYVSRSCILRNTSPMQESRCHSNVHSPQHKSHATAVLPDQCDLQPRIAEHQ